MLKFKLFLLALLLPLGLAAQNTTITDTIVDPLGNPANGTVFIALSAGCHYNGQYVAATRIVTQFTGGAFSVALVPNDNCVVSGVAPSGPWSSATSYTGGTVVSYNNQAWMALAASLNVAPGSNSADWALESASYQVVWSLSTGHSWSESWIVPTSESPLNVSSVRVVQPGLPSLVPGNFALGGDLSGTIFHALVIGLEGRPVASTAPTTGQSLIWNGTQWAPGNGGGGGTAGGDLSGTLAAATVIGLQRRAVASTAPSNNQALVWNQSALQWQPQNQAGAGGGTPGGSPGFVQYNCAGAFCGFSFAGDLGLSISGSTGTATVTGLQSRAVASAAPSNGNLLGWSLTNSTWEPAAIGGDIALSNVFCTSSLCTDSFNVAALQGHVLSSTAPGDGQVLTFNQSLQQWGPATLPGQAVTSVFGRVGTVVAQTNDYSFAQISGNLGLGQMPVGTIGNNTTGNAATATQFAASPTGCTFPQFALGIGTNGNASCATPSGGGGGGASLSYQLQDLTVARTSSTVLTLGANCSAFAPCNVRFGNRTFTIIASATAALSGSGTGTAYFYIDNSGAIDVGHNLTIGCSNCTQVPAVTAYPVNTLPIWKWTATTGAWDASGGTDQRAFLSTVNLTAGTGVVLTQTPGQTQIAADTTVIPTYASGTSTPGSCVSPAFYFNTTMPGTLYTCNGSTYQQVGGSGAGAVSSVFTRTGAVTAQTGDYTQSQIGGIGGTPSSSTWLRGDYSWQPLPALGGDLGGTLAAALVTGLQGVPVANSAPVDGQILQYTGGLNEWIASALPAVGANNSFQINQGHLLTGVSIGGDLAIGAPASSIMPATVQGLQGRPLSNANPVVNQAICWNGSQWGPGTCGGGGGGGASVSSQLLDLATVWTNSTVLTIGSNCSTFTPCNVRFGNRTFTFAFSSPVTATISGGATGSAYIYVTSAGVLTVGHNLTVACSTGCTQQAGITSFPANTVPLWTWAATTGHWSNVGGVDQRGFLTATALAGGTGIVLTQTPGQTAVSMDTTIVPVWASGTSTPGSCVAPALYFNTTGSGLLYICNPSGTYQAYVPQYQVSTAPGANQIPKLDGSGNETLPGNVSAASFTATGSGPGILHLPDGVTPTPTDVGFSAPGVWPAVPSGVSFTPYCASWASSPNVCTLGWWNLSQDVQAFTAVVFSGGTLPVQNSGYTAGATDSQFTCDATLGSPTIINLPALAGTGKLYELTKIDASANICEFKAQAADTISGGAVGSTIAITARWGRMQVRDAGAEWLRDEIPMGLGATTTQLLPQGRVWNGNGSNQPAASSTPTLGVQNSVIGQLIVAGSAGSAGSIELNIAGASGATNSTLIAPGANSAPVTVTFPTTTSGLIGESAADNTVTHVLHATANNAIGTFSAIADADLPHDTMATEFIGMLNGAFVPPTTTQYSSPGPITLSATAGLRAWPVLASCTLRNLLVYIATAQPNDNDMSFTLLDNSTTPGTPGTTTTLTVDFLANAVAGTMSDITHTYVVPTGHFLTMQVINNSASNSAQIASWAVLCEPN